MPNHNFAKLNLRLGTKYLIAPDIFHGRRSLTESGIPEMLYYHIWFKSITVLNLDLSCQTKVSTFRHW